MKFRLSLFTLFILAFFSIAIDGQVKAEENPLMIIKTATTKMIEELNLSKKEILNDSRIVMGIVEKQLIPHFASNTISRKVLGKHARKVTPEQKKQFADAFRFYMIRFYSKAFASYTNQTFEYLAAPETAGKKRVTVKTKLVQSGGQPIPIDYKMQRSGDSWKIIDLKIEGISMVISNRSQFGNQISHDGIDTVIAKLEYKNQQAQSND
ncbi:MAG: ABC transporter substrate-binding protein [Gammaproteobacteria bacterium]|nr:ABC transporter substrate-binding protein [Gammaproteobacteria bacterium]